MPGIFHGSRLSFCPRCGRFRRPNDVKCPKCGYIFIFGDREFLLNFIKRLLERERLEEKRRLFSTTVKGKVIDVSYDVVTIKCKISVFNDGDPISYVKNGEIRPLGTVLSKGRLLTVELYRPQDFHSNFKEGDEITLCESEILVGYDLQLDLINRLMREELSDVEKMAASCVFNGLNQVELSRADLEDELSVNGNFKLDESQIDAVKRILGLNEGEVLLIIGPPGTGKTEVIAKAAYELYKRGEKVLIASHTNRAVDNVLEKLPVDVSLRVGRPEKVLRSIRPYLLSYKARTILGDTLRKLEDEIVKTIKELRGLYVIKEEWLRIGNYEKISDIKSKLRDLKQKLKDLLERRNRMLLDECRKLIRDAKIIGSTLIKSNLPPLNNEIFDTVLIDEASQASITLALLGMIKARKWVLVGDHKQLLPIFRSTNDKDVQRMLSSFCYLLDKYERRALWLKYHYRCNSKIINFSCKYVYNGRIKPVKSCDDIKLKFNKAIKINDEMMFLSPDIPVVFLDVNGQEAYEGSSKYNDAEVEAITKIVKALKSLNIRSRDIGIITPYKAQRDHIKEALDDEDIEINTVDSFQGREKDVILFSITSTKDLHFVNDENRLNVAITRARKKLIIVGDAKAIEARKQGLLWQYLNYVKDNNGFFKWSWKGATQ